MLRILLILFYSIFCFIGGSCQADREIEAIFYRADMLYEQINSLEYFYRKADQYGIDPDTVQLFGNGYVEKHADNKLGYKYYISELSNNQTVIYDGKKVADIYHSDEFVEIYHPYKPPYDGHYYANFVPYVFTKNYFSDLSSDSLVQSISLEQDTLIEGNLCYQIRVESKSANIFYSSAKHYFFKKDNYFCLGYRGFDTYAGMPRHSAFIIVSAEANNELDKNLFKHYKNIPNGYEKIKGNKPIKQSPPLKRGKKLPNLTALTLDDKTITKEDLLNQVTVLHFWHIGCDACLEIAPLLDSLAINYKERGVKVFGLNPYDYKEDMIMFKQYSQLSYQPLIINEELLDKFKVSLYPTIFIINQKGRITHSTIGDEADLYKSLARQIEVLISR